MEMFKSGIKKKRKIVNNKFSMIKMKKINNRPKIMIMKIIEKY